MAIRPGDDDVKFKKLLQNPPKPVNDTKHSTEFEQYLKKLNDPLADKRKQENQRNDDNDYIYHCPHCRRPSLRRTARLTYICFHCGLETNSPLKFHK